MALHLTRIDELAIVTIDRAAVLNALNFELLRDLGWPLLIVAHSPEITEIANRVFRFNKPDEATGTQVTSAPNG